MSPSPETPAPGAAGSAPTVVVTGGAGGLGRAFALGFAGRGHDVVVADVNAEGAAETARLVEAEGVLLLPGSVIGHDGNHVRIGFGREDLPEALAGLERFLDRSPVGAAGR